MTTQRDEVQVIKITPLQHRAAQIHVKLSKKLGEEPDPEVVAMANAMTVAEYEALQRERDPSAE